MAKKSHKNSKHLADLIESATVTAIRLLAQVDKFAMLGGIDASLPEDQARGAARTHPGGQARGHHHRRPGSRATSPARALPHRGDAGAHLQGTGVRAARGDRHL